MIMKLPNLPDWATGNKNTITTLNLAADVPPLPTSLDPNVRYDWADNTFRNEYVLPYIRRAMAAARGDMDAAGKPSSAAKLGWMRRWVNSWRS